MASKSKTKSSALRKRKSKSDTDVESDSDFEPDSGSEFEDDTYELEYEDKLFKRARKEVKKEALEMKKEAEKEAYQAPRNPRKKKRARKEGGHFRCDFKDCDGSFATHWNLTRHKRIHTGDKRFKCKYCPKKCQERHQLDAHERTHTGEKPFECEKCGKDFTDDSNRKRHQDICKKIRSEVSAETESTAAKAPQEKRKRKPKSGTGKGGNTEEKKDSKAPQFPQMGVSLPYQESVPESGIQMSPLALEVPPMSESVRDTNTNTSSTHSQTQETPSAFQFVSPGTQQSLARLRSPTPVVKVEGGVSPRSKIAADLYMRVLTPLLMGRLHGTY
jgi:hypothetical protein